MIRYDDMFWL